MTLARPYSMDWDRDTLGLSLTHSTNSQEAKHVCKECYSPPTQMPMSSKAGTVTFIWIRAFCRCG